jgi:hypothetical protein
MRLTGSTVRRGLVLLEPDASDVPQTVTLQATIALARCDRCGKRCRVLPCDVLPRKTFGVAVIEAEVARYSRGDLSLREVAWPQLGERTPAHTTLHGWTEGLGAYVLGRAGGQLDGAPMSRFVVEAQARVPEIGGSRGVDPLPDPRRYRSEARRERLMAVMAAMRLVTLAAGCDHPHAIAECRRLSLSWSSLSTLEFPSRILCTPIGHRDRSEPPRSRSSSASSRDRCPTRTRSPPDASSRSHS